MTLKYAVGIDVSSDALACCISTIQSDQQVKVKATTTFKNSLPDLKKLEAWILKHHKERQVPLVIVLEATGVYYENCALFLFKNGHAVSVILPNKAKKYLQSKGLKSKNDSIDAKGLAQMAAEQRLTLWQPLTEFFFTLRAYTRQYQSLQETRTQITNQLHAVQHMMYPQKLVERNLKSIVKTLDKQNTSLKKAIEEHIKSNAEVSRKVEKLSTIKGVSLLTVTVLLAETNGFALIENQSQLVSYAGYDVVENQSGKRVGRTRISKKGNSRIRRCLHMPALAVVKYQVGPFVQLFERTFSRHGKKMKSYVAVQKKLLITLYALWKKDEEFSTQDQAIKPNAQEHLKPFSGFGLEQPIKESSPTIGRATQGKPTRQVTPSAPSGLVQI